MKILRSQGQKSSSQQDQLHFYQSTVRRRRRSGLFSCNSQYDQAMTRYSINTEYHTATSVIHDAWHAVVSVRLIFILARFKFN